MDHNGSINTCRLSKLYQPQAIQGFSWSGMYAPTILVTGQLAHDIAVTGGFKEDRQSAASISSKGRPARTGPDPLADDDQFYGISASNIASRC